MRFTAYFEAMRKRPDRCDIDLQWIERAIMQPLRRETQPDGRIRLWAAVPEAQGRYLRVVLLEDGQTVHNAFFDRRFTP